MRNRNYGLYAIALAIVVLGVLWAGLPAASLALFGLLLVCPLMMFFMMRGMHGGQGGHAGHTDQGGQGHQHNVSDRAGPHDHSTMR